MNCFAAKRGQKVAQDVRGVLPKPRSGVRRQPSAEALVVRVRPCHSPEGAADLKHLPPLRGLCPLGNQTQGLTPWARFCCRFAALGNSPAAINSDPGPTPGPTPWADVVDAASRLRLPAITSPNHFQCKL